MSHKNGPKSSVAVVANGGKWWQVGIGRRCDGGQALLRRMQKFSEFDKNLTKWFHHALLPSEAADLVATRHAADPCFWLLD